MNRQSRLLIAFCGLVGPIILVMSFLINPAPPTTATVAQLRDYALQHHNGIVLGGWLQGMGSLLIVLFSIGLVHLAGAASRVAGWVTLLAGGVILVVSLVEITFYFAAVQGTEIGDTSAGWVANSFIKAVQHVFLIAPALLLPLGFVLRTTRILPRGFASTALLIGALLQVLGLAGLFRPLQSVIDVILVIQSGWFIAAAGAVLLQSGRVIDAAA